MKMDWLTLSLPPIFDFWLHLWLNGHALVLVENGGEYPPPSKLVIREYLNMVGF